MSEQAPGAHEPHDNKPEEPLDEKTSPPPSTSETPPDTSEPPTTTRPSSPGPPPPFHGQQQQYPTPPSSGDYPPLPAGRYPVQPQYPPPGWNQGVQQPQPAPESPYWPKKSDTRRGSTTRRLLFIIGGFALLLALGGFLLFGGAMIGPPDTARHTGNHEQYPGNDSPSNKPAPNLPTFGEAATDGSFIFTVDNVESGVPSIGDGYGSATAQGEYFVFDVTIMNDGSQPGTYDEFAQILTDIDGNEYRTDPDATVYMEDDSWLADINPGNRINVSMAFDVPHSIELSTLTLHESMDSEGVDVNVSQ